VHLSGETARHGHDGDRVACGRRGPYHLFGASLSGAGLAEHRFQVGDKRRDGGVVEGQGGRQREAAGLAEVVAQPDRGQRVEAEVLERAGRVDPVPCFASEHRGDLRLDQLVQRLSPLRR